MNFACAKRFAAIIGTLIALLLIAGGIVSFTPYGEKLMPNNILSKLTPEQNMQPILTSEQNKQPVLTDGEVVPYFGAYHFSPVGENGLKTYVSGKLGFSLSYPKGYLLFENSNDTMRIIGIVPEMSALASISRIQAGVGGGGPISINIYAYAKPASFTTLEAWAKENSQYVKFQAEAGAPVPTTTPVTIDGVTGIQFKTNYGMYESDIVMFTHGDLVYIADAQESTRPDLPAILSSIKWK